MELSDMEEKKGILMSFEQTITNKLQQNLSFNRFFF